MTRYLAEGASNAFFRTRSPSATRACQPAVVLLRFQTDSGAIVAPRRDRAADLARAPSSGHGHRPGEHVVLDGRRVRAADRRRPDDDLGRQRLRQPRARPASSRPATTWYFAEGSTSGDVRAVLPAAEPAATAVARRRCATCGRSALPPIVRSYTLPAAGRTTMPGGRRGAELASTDVSAVITAAQPIVAERAMYRARPGQPFAAGHESAGVTAPAIDWFLAEGATGALLRSVRPARQPEPDGGHGARSSTCWRRRRTARRPTPCPATAASRSGSTTSSCPPGRGTKPLADVAVSTARALHQRRADHRGAHDVVAGAANDRRLLVRAHNAPGATAPALRWGIASGDVGYPDVPDTYVLIANPGAAGGRAEVRVYRPERQQGDAHVRPAGEEPDHGWHRHGRRPDSGVWGPLSVVVRKRRDDAGANRRRIGVLCESAWRAMGARAVPRWPNRCRRRQGSGTPYFAA